MILVKLEFPSLVRNKELCSCPFNGQIPALPSDSEAQVPPAHVLLSVTLHNPFQCSGKLSAFVTAKLEHIILSRALKSAHTGMSWYWSIFFFPACAQEKFVSVYQIL